MKKQFFMVSAIVSIALFVQAQNFNIEQLGHLSYNEKLSDVWAYSTEDSLGVKEYALVGVNNGLSIVDVTTPAEPVELHFIIGRRSNWRDMKTYDNYAYVSNESGGGVLIVDLNNLPDEAPSEIFIGDDEVGFKTAHNVFVDEFGILYVIGADYSNGGCIMYDLNEDPLNPKRVGVYDETYVHDAYARNNILYTSEINRGVFSIVDVSDKSNPVILGNAPTPNIFTHNCWLSEDGNTLFTTDERPGSFIGSFDISDPADIKELDRIQSSPGEMVTPHNTHVLNDFLVTSYYRDGVTIHDASKPDSIVQVAGFDTSIEYAGSGFNGCWGTTPFLPSGNILASDIETGLYILKPTYKRAGYVNGLVSDIETNEALENVTVTILNQPASAATDLEGNYTIGTGGSSTVEVQFYKPGYEIRIDTIELVEYETQILNVSLQEKENFAINVEVYDNDTEEKIPDVIVQIVNEEFRYDEKTNEAGTLNIEKFYEGTFYLLVGKWGYQTIADTITFSVDKNTYSADITAGYYDDFALDLGWQVSGDAATGMWERGVPIGTSFYGTPSNPGNDVEGDIADICYVTDNRGGGAGSFDIDDGSTVLTSPIFNLSDATAPVLNYSRWFYNDGGQGTPPNDMLTIYLFNGTDTVTLETVNNESEGNSSWIDKAFDLTEVDIDLTATMTLILETGDLPEGHLVEAGFDYFYIMDNPVGIIANQYSGLNLNVQLSQNPFIHQLQFTLSEAFLQVEGKLSIHFISIDGKKINAATMQDLNYTWQPNNLPKGIYQYYISSNKGFLYTDKVIKL